VRGVRAIHWIETFCLVPDGPDKGKHVRLSLAQRDTIRQIYDNPNGPLGSIPVTGVLAGYLALLHTAGPEALQRLFRPNLSADIFTVWNATGPDLREVLKREGGHVVCPELGTRWPVAA
jgi:hypothetical protein